MKIITIDKKDCPYCDVALEVKGDSDKSLFKWHLANHSIAQVFYRTNEKIEELIANYAHGFRSERYDMEIITIMLRDFWKKAINESEEIQALKKHINMTKQNTEWEESLRLSLYNFKACSPDYNEINIQEIKEFISQLLKEQREEIEHNKYKTENLLVQSLTTLNSMYEKIQQAYQSENPASDYLEQANDEIKQSYHNYNN